MGEGTWGALAGLVYAAMLVTASFFVAGLGLAQGSALPLLLFGAPLSLLPGLWFAALILWPVTGLAF